MTKRLWSVGLLLVIGLLAACSAAGGQGDDLEGALPSGSGVVYTWHREGGIAGFCDDVTVYADGRAEVASCAGDGKASETELTAAQQEQVSGWASSLASFDKEQSDAATADAMTIRIDFTGQGTGQPTDADIQAMNGLASALVAQARQTGSAGQTEAASTLRTSF